VRYSAEAAERLATFHRRRRGMLKREIDMAAASAPKERFVQVRTPVDVAACEVLEDHREVAGANDTRTEPHPGERNPEQGYQSASAHKHSRIW